MHKLVKFTTEEFAAKFQSGKLYMNSLDYFMNNGFEGQNDTLEGVILSASPQRTVGIPSEFKNHIITDVFYQAVGFSFCHIFCMSCLDIVPVIITPSGTIFNITIPSNMENFGAYAVMIDDKAEFLRRINRAFTSQKYLCGRINYHSITLDGKKAEIGHHLLVKNENAVPIAGIAGTVQRYDAFDKFDKYKYQNEWRICFYDGVAATEPYELDIGDIHDISHVIKTCNLEDEIFRLKSSDKSLRTSEKFYGNVSRQELRTLFYGLGGNEAWQYLTIG